MSDPISQFRDALAARGILPPKDLIADGTLHRCYLVEGKNGKKDASYLLHLDGIPAGGFENWRDGLGWENWRADIGRTLTPEEEAAHRERIRAAQAARAEEEAQRHAEAAKEADRIFKESSPAMEHPYLTRKGIKPHSVRIGADGRLVIPVRDAEYKPHSLQFIGADGTKRFLTDGRKAGCYYSIGKPNGVLCIAEGFATGASIHEATGHAVAVAFDAGNLKPVAKALRAKLPDVRIVLCADDDWKTDGNPGMTKATEAARAVGGCVAVPVFGKERADGQTDFNDMAVICGLEAVRETIEAALSAENAESSGSWPAPRPIPDALLPVIPFDFELLPESLRPWITDIADRMQCPPDFVAVAAMAALSSVIGRKACIAPKRHDDWRVIPNLWAVAVGRPGVMKSPALTEAMKPLYRLQEETDKAFHAALRSYELEAELQDMSGRQTKSKAREAMQNGDEQEARKLLEASRTVEADKPPARRRYVVNDSSVEALGEILIENPWGLLAYRDELHGLLCSMEKEGQEGARAFYLQGYDGNQGYTFDRIGRGKNLTIPAVCIALLGGIQPGKLAGYIRDAVSGGRGDDGLLQRFGLLVWPDDSGWKNVDRYPDAQAKQQAFEMFKRLDEMKPALSETGESTPREYRFTPDAQDIFDRWRYAFENDLRDPERHPAMESHLAKYRKLVPALALVIALADGENAVSRAALLMALGWAKYLQSHAERAYATGTGPRVDAARALLNKIGKGDLSDGFSARAVYRKGWANLLTEKDAALAAEILCDLGYLKAMEIPPGAAGGRPTVNYLVHPDYLPKKGA